MDAKAIVQAGYNAIAAEYLAARTKDSQDVRLLQDLVARLPRGARVLDAGCGAGMPVTKILCEKFLVIGVDFSTAQIELARRNAPRAEFVCADLTALELPAESFDAICSYYAIIHVPRAEHRAILLNFWRMLKAGGLALLCLGAGDLNDDIEEDYFGARMYWSHFDAETNIRMMMECGFEIIWSKRVADESFSGAAHLFVLAIKPQNIVA